MFTLNHISDICPLPSMDPRVFGLLILSSKTKAMAGKALGQKHLFPSKYVMDLS